MPSKQKDFNVRRIYNKLVANEMMEDFALRFTARSARKWSLGRVSSTALGIISFLVLEAIGGAITLTFGFENAAWAILTVSLIVFFTGLPISYYAAKYGVDIDLLSRGAGFGYIGSVITSLIYASFTFIFFALEAAIMSMAFTILFNIPSWLAYILSALLVLPLVSFGITYISRFQAWSTPIWVVLQLLPLFFVFSHQDSQLSEWFSFTGGAGDAGGQFNYLLFGGACAVLLSLVAQIGEQVDILRFLPEKSVKKKISWWCALIAGGPGWIVFGAMKLFLGSFLAYLAVQQGLGEEYASDPAHMYQLAFSYVFENPTLSLWVACSFVILSQLKINVANAYAGSLAWSNFFSRVARNHPGRVVWMVFNVAIALLLMELGIYQTIEKMLSVYSVLVLAWLCSVVADLVINKPLGISPAHIEFKRAKLFDINPVGVGSMLITTFIGVTAHLAWYGDVIKASASFIACALPFILVPLIGYLTKGKYYLVPQTIPLSDAEKKFTKINASCHVCEHSFDGEDMSFCPAYGKAICSLCCSLDARCGDICRPDATIYQQSSKLFKRFLSDQWIKKLSSPLMQFIAVTCVMSSVGAAILALVYLQVPIEDAMVKQVFFSTLIKIFFLLLIIIGIISWLFILARNGNKLALKELRSQTDALAKEIGAHKETSSELQSAKEVAEAANEAKSRYLASLSHELRTPLNVLLGYAQLLKRDPALPSAQRESIAIIKRNGEHLADLIEGLLEISKIEAGRMTLQRDEVNFKSILKELVEMFQMQANIKGLKFIFLADKNLPGYVRTDKQRFRQILINLISNAIKYTETGSVTFKVSYRSEVASFSVIDTGVGISKQDQCLVFKPFEQIRNQQTENIAGTGLGLTISKSLAELMGGEISLKSTVGEGSIFNFKLMLFNLHKTAYEPVFIQPAVAVNYEGSRRSILVVDDDFQQRQLMQDLLHPIGFTVLLAENAMQAFEKLKEEQVDLILMDVRMPSVSGWEMIKMVREKGMNMPVIMVSANARDAEYKLQAEQYHNGYIAKPINIDSLLGKITELLAIQWCRQKDEEKQVAEKEITEQMANKPLASSNQYQSLITLAEIGYLSGFKNKLVDIQKNFHLPNEIETQISDYVKVCNFPKIIEYLSELSDEK